MGSVQTCVPYPSLQTACAAAHRQVAHCTSQPKQTAASSNSYTVVWLFAPSHVAHVRIERHLLQSTQLMPHTQQPRISPLSAHRHITHKFPSAQSSLGLVLCPRGAKHRHSQILFLPRYHAAKQYSCGCTPERNLAIDIFIYSWSAATGVKRLWLLPSKNEITSSPLIQYTCGPSYAVHALSLPMRFPHQASSQGCCYAFAQPALMKPCPRTPTLRQNTLPRRTRRRRRSLRNAAGAPS